MKICDFLTLNSREQWPLIQQIGVTNAVAKLAPEITRTLPPWDRDAFAAHQQTYRDHGFEIVALEGDQFDMTRIKEGLPGRDEDLERYRQMLTHMGELGIPLLCYNFMVRTGWYRNSHNLTERGGALVSGFTQESESPSAVEPELEEENIRANYTYFLEAVLPAAEQAGVTLAVHPDDPPCSPLRGVGRILKSINDIASALEVSASPAHRLTFCQANFRLMDAVSLTDNIARFSDRIAYVHWRDVAGDAENFRETFHDNGPTDMVTTLRAYRDAGLDVPIRVDHVPALHGESTATGYTFLGRLHAIGFLQGILASL